MAIVLHPLVDLSRTWPPFFVQNLRDVFTHGSGKSGSKFQLLRNQLVKSLPSAPPPGPATFIVKCLEALIQIGPPHAEGLSHLLISAFCQSDRSKWPKEDNSIARSIGGSLFCDALAGNIPMESRVVVKLPGTFGFDLKDIGGILIFGSHNEVVRLEAAKEFVGHYILDLLKRRLYNGAVSLLKNFNLQTCDYHSLIVAMVDNGQTSLAIEWASHLGKESVAFLVQHCTEVGMYKVAYKVVQQFNLEADFPDSYHLYRESSLRKLVGKGLWDVAESIAEGDTHLMNYLVILAIEENETEKVLELCEHFNLDHSQMVPEIGYIREGPCHLQVQSLLSEEKIHWIDNHEGLEFSGRALFGVSVVGVDCEWKAGTMKGAELNKVSILQVASADIVVILDLITLSQDCRSSLHDFIKNLFHAPGILKIGYAIHNDLGMLSRSYPEIEAFRACESVLDLQRVFGREMKGGLSGLAKSILGSSLNKNIRMSDWERRPLSKKQLHYAALDALVLLPIFDSIAHVVPETHDWKVHMTSFKVSSKNPSKLDDPKELDRPFCFDSLLTSHENLVLETCELLGIPIPGLLKSELFHFTQAAKLPPPLYTAVTTATLTNETAFYSTVKVGGATFSGRLATSKKDAEFWASQVALSKLKIGKVENCLAYCEKQTRRRSFIQTQSSSNRFGCARLMQGLNRHGWKARIFMCKSSASPNVVMRNCA